MKLFQPCRPHHLDVAIGKPDNEGPTMADVDREQLMAAAHIPAAINLEHEHCLRRRLDLFDAVPCQPGVDGIMAPLVRWALRTNKNTRMPALSHLAISPSSAPSAILRASIFKSQGCWRCSK